MIVQLVTRVLLMAHCHLSLRALALLASGLVMAAATTAIRLQTQMNATGDMIAQIADGGFLKLLQCQHLHYGIH